MQLPTTLQGRPFGPEQLAQIQALLAQRSDWSRYRLSRELARLWDWHTPQGQLKDMAARTLLLKLEQRGLIELPPLRMKSPTRSGRPPVLASEVLEADPINGALNELRPLSVCEVSQGSGISLRRQLEAALHRYHYLGYRSRVGQNLQYWVCDRQDHPVAAVVCFLHLARPLVLRLAGAADRPLPRHAAVADFALDDLPQETTAATRRRIAEVVAGAPAAEIW